MKGVINKGVQEFVIHTFGQETWEAATREAACDEPFFATNQYYPDELTGRLFEAVSAIRDIPVEELHVACGRFMVPNTLKKSYPAYFSLLGSDSRQFLLNVREVHRRVTLMVPGARPPELTCESSSDGSLIVSYESPRGLRAFLKGLILGVGDLFEQELQVETAQCQQKTSSIFRLRVVFP